MCPTLQSNMPEYTIDFVHTEITFKSAHLMRGNILQIYIQHTLTCTHM